MKAKALFPFILIFIGLLLSPSCKKEDTGDGRIPEIEIIGFNPIFWAKDIPYVDLGAIAYDINSEGDTIDISNKIITENTVDVSVEGDYTVIYNVTDDSGLKAEEKTRVVKVVIGK